MFFYKNICSEVFDPKNINNDILEMNNMNPSYTRQHSGEWEAQQKREMENRVNGKT